MDHLPAAWRGAATAGPGPLSAGDRLPLALIAAVARNGVIGVDNGLPWRLPGDLRHFKTVTTGKPVLMGRRTYQSIGRPLPGRPVLVLSRDPAFDPPGVTVVRTLADALARADAIGKGIAAPEVMLAGGAELYAALIGNADRLCITHVEAAPPGDAFFPPIDDAVWREEERSAATDEDGRPFYAFAVYRRRRPTA